ncbi:LysM peptidoglycan-binding domain-containing protein [Kitasatospora sp. NPDC059747]|uniref:LysM peptidoglycan-binding domain-containing protein n=1 Tax=Kitasatospora sp. NPDC059747 TaxID=3346930 RepID=UPI003656D63A
MTDEPDDTGGAPDLKGGFGKKVGPLPMGVWILAIGGGLVLAYMMRSRSKAAADPGTTTSGAAAGVDDWNYGKSNGVGQGVSGGAVDTPTTTAITTNEQWQRRAVQILTGLGYEPTVVDAAVGAYLQGQQLTTIQRAIVNEAILRIGPPPISPPPPVAVDKPPDPQPQPQPQQPPPPPPPPVIVQPPPPPPPPPPAPDPQPQDNRSEHQKWMDWTDPIWVTVQHGENLGSIAARYGMTGYQVYDYNLIDGIRSGDSQATIRSRGPNLTYAGSTWLIPRRGRVFSGGHD